MAVNAQRVWTIRHATAEDGRPVRRFVFDILNEYHVAADPDDSDQDVMAFGAPAEGVVQLVAEVDDEPIGSAILTPYSDAEIKLSKLFLKPEFRVARARAGAARARGGRGALARLRAHQPGHARVVRRGGAALRALRLAARPRPPAPGPGSLLLPRPLGR